MREYLVGDKKVRYNLDCVKAGNLVAYEYEKTTEAFKKCERISEDLKKNAELMVTANRGVSFVKAAIMVLAITLLIVFEFFIKSNIHSRGTIGTIYLVIIIVTVVSWIIVDELGNREIVKYKEYEESLNELLQNTKSNIMDESSNISIQLEIKEKLDNNEVIQIEKIDSKSCMMWYIDSNDSIESKKIQADYKRKSSTVDCDVVIDADCSIHFYI